MLGSPFPRRSADGAAMGSTLIHFSSSSRPPPLCVAPFRLSAQMGPPVLKPDPSFRPRKQVLNDCHCPARRGNDAAPPVLNRAGGFDVEKLREPLCRIAEFV